MSRRCRMQERGAQTQAASVWPRLVAAGCINHVGASVPGAPPLIPSTQTSWPYSRAATPLGARRPLARTRARSLRRQLAQRRRSRRGGGGPPPGGPGRAPPPGAPPPPAAPRPARRARPARGRPVRSRAAGARPAGSRAPPPPPRPCCAAARPHPARPGRGAAGRIALLDQRCGRKGETTLWSKAILCARQDADHADRHRH